MTDKTISVKPVTVIISAVLCTLLSEVLESTWSGLSPIYPQLGALLAATAVFGWSGLLLASFASLLTIVGWDRLNHIELQSSLDFTFEFASIVSIGLIGFTIRSMEPSGWMRLRLTARWRIAGAALVAVFFTYLRLVNEAELSIAQPQLFAERLMQLLIAYIASSILFTYPLFRIYRDANLRRATRSTAWPVFLIITLTAFLLAWMSEQRTYNRIAQHIESHLMGIHSILEKRLVAHREILASAAHVIELYPELTPEQFEHITGVKLRDNPDIFALSYNPLVLHGERAEFEAQLATLVNRESLSIIERKDGEVIPALERPYYVPVSLIAPLASNADAVGFDINSNPVRKRAIDIVNSSGLEAVTAPINLIQEKQQRKAVLLLSPVYKTLRNNLKSEKSSLAVVGYSVAVIKVDELFGLNLEEVLHSAIRYRWYDGAINDPEMDFVDLKPQAGRLVGEFAQSADIRIANRTWKLEVEPSVEHLNALGYTQDDWLAIWGFIVGGIIYLFFLGREHEGREIRRQVKLKTQELSDANVALEKQIAVNEQTLFELRERKERQEELFAIIGHELRTPVSSMQMMLDAEDADPKVNFAEKIRVTVAHLVSILDDMRYSMRPDAQRNAERVEADPVEVIKRAVDLTLPLLESKGIQLQLDFKPQITGIYSFSDKVIRQIVHNLVRNAALHSGGTQLLVECSAKANRDGLSLILTFDDDGVGIAPDIAPHLFEAFYRGNSKVDGTGLGLSICRNMAQHHGGDLALCHSKLGGACFRLELLLDAVKVETPKAVSSPAEGADLWKQRSVLLAEDNKTIQLLTSTILASMGADVRLADNGEEALKLAKQQHFDLILTDIFMPQMDGFELTQQLRMAGYTGPIVGATAATVGDETDRLLAAGADRVLAKPVNKQKLVEVAQALQERLVSKE